jgi:hypothetical protein
MVQEVITNKNAAAAGMQNFADTMIGQQISPSGPNGPIDYGKFRLLERQSQMKVPGAPSSEDLEHMRSEFKNIESVENTRKTFNEAFSRLDSMAAAGKLSPHERGAVVNTLSASIQRAANGQYNKAEADSLAESMFPQATDWGRTRSVKLQEAQKFFNHLVSPSPMTKAFVVKNEQYQPSPKKGSEEPKANYAEGATGMFGKTPVVFHNGKWVKK